MTLEELRERQKWTLEQKIDHSIGVINQFVERMGGVDKVYIAWSGGKDSTVLMHLAHMLYPDILAVFCNTGNEYPDILRFISKKEQEGWNVLRLRPAMTPRQVWAKYGFPLVGKELAQRVHEIRISPNSATSIKYLNKQSFGMPIKWRFLLNEQFNTSHKCCTILKKNPSHKFEKESGRRPILGTMASESQLREKTYIQHGGCNQFDRVSGAKSFPLSIWTDDDIWEYIRRFNMDIAEVYHKGAKRTGCMGCGFGAHFADDQRFGILLDLYPKCYDMVMGYTNNGVTFRQAIRRVMAVNGKSLPDEMSPTLFDDIVP